MKPNRAWQAPLLIEIRRTGILRRAIEFVPVSLSTVRRAIVADKRIMGLNSPFALHRLIEAARRAHLDEQKRRRAAARQRRLAALEEQGADKRVARAKAAAAARWSRR